MRFTPLCITSLALAPALLAQRFPEVEPNGTNATAQAIAVGTQIDCSLVAAEQDWFSFSVATNTRIRIHTSGLTTGADTRIGLLDSTGTVYLGMDDDARGSTTSNFASDLTLNVAAGSYMVQIVGFSATSAGGYSLEVSELTPVVYDGTEAAEPTPGSNDSAATALTTGALGTGVKRFLGNIAPAGVVLTDTVAAAPSATVAAGVVGSGNVLFTGVVGVPTGAASTATVTQAVTSLPLANPPLASYASPASTNSLLFTSGINNGLSRAITASTVFTLTTAAFPAAAAPGDTFQIVTGPNTTTNTWVGALPLASLFVGGSAYSMRMTSGTNIGLSRAITANTGPAGFGSVVTTAAFPVANAVGDTFDIDMTVTATTVFKTTAALVPGAYSPATGANSLGQYQVRFTSGANVGVVRQIAGNTASTITLVVGLTAAAAAGDSYVIEKIDCDYYQIVLTAPTNGFWFQINEGDAPSVYGHKYELYDAAGNALLPVGATQLPSFGTQNGVPSTFAPRTSSARMLPAGTYHLSVRGTNTTAPFHTSTTMPVQLLSGNYMLELFTSRMDVGGTVAEVEPNNSLATASPLAPGQIGTGNLTISSGADASDWFGPIVISTPSTLFYQTRRGATGTPMLDTTINLRDSAGNIANAATGGNVLDAPWTTASAHARQTISFFLTPATYYIEVISPGTAFGQSGDYELQVGEVIGAPYVNASYATVTANATGCGVGSVPTLTRQFPSETPVTGATFSRQCTGLTPSGFGLFVQSFSLFGGGAPVPPLDLTAFGAPGCLLHVDTLLISLVFADPTGAVELQLNVPGSTALRGAVLWEQMAKWDFSVNALGIQPGNYARIIVGERSF